MDGVGVTILHVSDTQFGRNHRYGRLGLASPDDAFDTLIGRLRKDLRQLRDELAIAPDLIAVTGDLTEWGRPGEFADVARFLGELTNFLQLSRSRVLVIPGNHDISRAECEAYFKQCEARETKPELPYAAKWGPYEAFTRTFYGELGDRHFDAARPWQLVELPDLQLAVACMNSTMRESHLDADHYGWVGEHQLEQLADRLLQCRTRGWFRLGLVHHNPIRGAVTDDEHLRDVDDLKRILGTSLNLILHGHTHVGRLDWLTPTLPVLATGSAAVNASARPDEVPNQYQLIRIKRDGLWHGARQYAPREKRWVGDTRVSATGNDWTSRYEIRFDLPGTVVAGGERPYTTTIAAPARPPGGLAELLRRLADSDPLIALPAAEALRRGHGPEVVDEVAALPASNVVGETAIRSVMAEHANRSGELMVKLILASSVDNDSPSYEAALRVRHLFGPAHLALGFDEPLGKALGDDVNNAVLYHAIIALGHMGAMRWHFQIRDLVGIRGDKNEALWMGALSGGARQFVHAAVHPIHKQLYYGDALTNASRHLVELLELATTSVRDEVFRIVGVRDALHQCTKEHADRLMRDWVVASNDDISRLGLDALGVVGIGRSVTQIADMLDRLDLADRRVATASNALGSIGTRAAVEALAKHGPGSPKGVGLARCLDKLPAHQFAGAARLLVDSPDTTWRVHRASGVARVAGWTDELRRALHSNAAAERGSAALALARLDRRAHRDEVLEARHEAGGRTERVLATLAVLLVAPDCWAKLEEELRSDLGYDAFGYVPPIQADILDVLTAHSEPAAALARAWRPFFFAAARRT